MKVALVYGARPEIYSLLSWNALVHLASPSTPSCRSGGAGASDP